MSRLTSRSSERPLSRAVLLSQLSAGVAQLIVSAALKVTMRVFEKGKFLS